MVVFGIVADDVGAREKFPSSARLELPTLRTELKNALPIVIQAEGVFVQARGRVLSSTPETCGVISRHPRRRRASRSSDLASATGLERGVRSFGANIGSSRADTQARYFFDHGNEIGQRANRVQGRRLGRADQAPRRGQHQGILDDHQRHAALVRGSGASRSWVPPEVRDGEGSPPSFTSTSVFGRRNRPARSGWRRRRRGFRVETAGSRPAGGRSKHDPGVSRGLAAAAGVIDLQ
jgi:hypothetical protein